MSALVGNLTTDTQPPMTVPLRHFLVSFAFLLAGLGVGFVEAVNAVPGLGRLALALVLSALPWLVGFGSVMLVGFWVFVYNVGLTLTGVSGYDVTERHFLFALLCVLSLTTLGIVLAVDFTEIQGGCHGVVWKSEISVITRIADSRTT